MVFTNNRFWNLFIFALIAFFAVIALKLAHGLAKLTYTVDRDLLCAQHTDKGACLESLKGLGVVAASNPLVFAGASASAVLLSGLLGIGAGVLAIELAKRGFRRSGAIAGLSVSAAMALAAVIATISAEQVDDLYFGRLQGLDAYELHFAASNLIWILSATGAGTALMIMALFRWVASRGSDKVLVGILVAGAIPYVAGLGFLVSGLWFSGDEGIALLGTVDANFTIGPAIPFAWMVSSDAALTAWAVGTGLMLVLGGLLAMRDGSPSNAAVVLPQ